MPWKFVCDLRFHEVLQTTIIRQITKEKYIFISVCLCVYVFSCMRL